MVAKITKGSRAGPFGGEGGGAWDDGLHTTIRQLIIYNESVIDSIQIEYDDNGHSKWSKKYGESDGGKRNVVKLDYPDEFIIAISGYYTEDSHQPVVRSLTIESNKNQYGPFGVEHGTYFSTPSDSGKIIGLHGRSGLYLDSIGAHFNPDTSISVGPFGGSGGHEWNDGVYTTIRKLVIHHGTVVDSIEFEYDNHGRCHWSKYGQSEGGQRNVVTLDYPNEFLISMSGYCTEDSNSAVVRSLTFLSNKNQYGPYGIEEGTYFSTLTSGKIIGFHGRCGLYLDSIGAYFEPFSKPCQSIAVGPFGGHEGHQWDDGSYSTVRQLIIFSGLVIDSIQIEYDRNGRSKWSDKHGRSNGGDKNMVKLDYPGEFLLSIWGYYNTDSEFGTVIRSLTIETNKRTCGPFGTEIGHYFKLPLTSGKIIGFNGRSGYYLDSIGAHYEPILEPFRPMSMGPFGGLGGGQWDDGIYTTVRQFVIFSGSFINSIQFEYDRKGQSEWSQKHGKCEGGHEAHSPVKLDYPGEFLISISGYHGQISGHHVIRSLTIESNKATYGPYGVKEGEYFHIPPTKGEISSGKIIGFHGRSGEYLDSIGAHTEPFSKP